VFAHGFRSPRALVWQPASGSAWLADEKADGEGILYAIEPQSPRVRGTVRRAFRLPQGVGTSAMMFYRSGVIPEFEHNLFIASQSGEQLLRITFDSADPLRIAGSESLLRGRVGPLRLVAEAPDGAIYVATRHELARLAARQR
jgi:glucose/arabinose dehydrogenase